MRKDILKNLQQEIYDRCQKETNKFGMGCYYHIVAVVKNAEILAEEYGAEMAYSILKEYGYEDKKILLVQKCIKNHRGSISLEKNSIEELCVADADAISHFDSLPSLLYLAYVQRGMGIEDGKEFVKNKLIRSFQKLSARSKKHYQNKFEKTMEVLG